MKAPWRECRLRAIRSDLSVLWSSVWLAGPALLVVGQLGAAAPAVVLTNIAQIHLQGGESSASNRLQARFTGIVVYPSLSARRLYVQDGEHAIQVHLSTSAAGFDPGHRVEVTGAVMRALPFPRVIGAKATIVGKGALPEPKPTTIAQIGRGQDPYRFLSVRAIIRDLIAQPNWLTMVGTDGDDSCEIVVEAKNFPMPREWLDAELELQGMAFPFFTDQSKPDFSRFHVFSPAFIHVIKPGISNVMDCPLMTVAEAGRQPWDGQRLIKVTGTVTAHHSARVLFVEDETGPMQVALLWFPSRPEGSQSIERDPKTWLEPGERVEVVGVRHGPYSLVPTLIHSDSRRIGKTAPIAPRPVTVRQLQAGEHAGRVVSVEGRLLDQRGWRFNALRRHMFVIQSGEQAFQAVWEGEELTSWNAKPGSYVRVTGVNDATRGQSDGAATFQIILRSPADMIEVPPPPFWKQSGVRRVLLGAGVVGLLAAAFILVQRFHLRRLEQRVAKRTEELRQMNSQLQGEVTARERAESDLRVALQTEKELGELRSNFVSMVSHQFRTPLGAILSCAEILQHYQNRITPEKREKHLQTIQGSVIRMSGLVDEVLLFQRSEAGQMDFRPAPLDVPALCRQLIDEVLSATARRCPIDFDADGAIPSGYADERLLRHALTNLLENAAKYSPAGSEVRLSLGRDGDQAIFTVRDLGPGIPAADQAKLFTPFHRGRNVRGTSGTGLGMVIVKRCVERHGGQLTVESVEGSGTAVTVKLPLFSPPSPATETATFPKNTV